MKRFKIEKAPSEEDKLGLGRGRRTKGGKTRAGINKMKLWRRAAAALKDQKSLLAASFKRRTSYRNPDLEAAVINATSHDDISIDYKNVQRVYDWISASPANLRPLCYAIAKRVEGTHSWVVTLKALMLMHGVLCCKEPAIAEIRQMPFDLSCFSDGHSRLGKMWGFNAFVRSYFAFLDQYSAFLSDQIRMRGQNKRYLVAEETMIQQLSRLEKLQALLDMLLQIRPMADNMKTKLILEAMDCIIIETVDIYRSLCNGIAKVLLNMNSAAGKLEAEIALRILQKAETQGEDLCLYFEICKEFGVSNAHHQDPKFVQVPEEDILAIERMIHGVEETKEELIEEEKAVILVEKELNTIITDKWEVFEDDLTGKENEKRLVHEEVNPPPVRTEDQLMPLIVFNEPVYVNHTIPDLITF